MLMLWTGRVVLCSLSTLLAAPVVKRVVVYDQQPKSRKTEQTRLFTTEKKQVPSEQKIPSSSAGTSGTVPPPLEPDFSLTSGHSPK